MTDDFGCKMASGDEGTHSVWAYYEWAISSSVIWEYTLQLEDNRTSLEWHDEDKTDGTKDSNRNTLWCFCMAEIEH